MQTYLHGGSYKEETRKSFFVEEHVRKISVSWLSTNKKTELHLFSPDGNIYHDFTMSEDDSSIIEGAFVYSILIELPAAGIWTLQAKNKEERYIFNVAFDSPLNDDINLDVETDEAIHLYFSSGNPEIRIEDIEISLSVEYMDLVNKQMKKTKLSNIPVTPRVTFQPFGNGIYNITIDIIGKTRAGNPFNRTVIESIYFGNMG